MDKPTILVIDDERRYRAPLLGQFYTYILQETFPLNVIFDERRHEKIPKIIDEKLEGKIPDYVQIGFGDNSSLTNSLDFIKNNREKIKIIYDPGDYATVIARRREYVGIEVDFLLLRLPSYDIENHKHMQFHFERWRSLEEFSKTKFIYIPWGVTPTFYDYTPIERDIDVSMICTATFGSRCENRFKAIEAMKRLQDKVNIYCTTHCGPKLTTSEDPINGDTFDTAYLNILRRSKLFVVEGEAYYDFPVQKYFEAPMCGAAMIGHIPNTISNLFKHDESIIEVVDYDRLDEIALEYLKNYETIKSIAEKGKEVVLNNFTLDVVTKSYVDTILEDYKNRNGQ